MPPRKLENFGRIDRYMEFRTLKYAFLTSCLLMALAACERGSENAAVATKPVPSLEMLQVPAPPIVIDDQNDADWDRPQAVPEPEIFFEPVAFEPDLTGFDVAPVEIADVEVEDVAPTAEAAPRDLLRFLGADIEPGKLVQTTWTAGESLHGAAIPTPVLVARGMEDGPTLCVTAAIHGDELNGIESVRRLMHSLKPERLSGMVVGVPIVNLQGFQRHSRYLSDRRDLNRFFPGNPRGSSASRMAHGFFNDVISHCDGLVDLHTGSFHRTNLPQLRADLKNADVLALTRGFGSTVILHSSGAQGTLRRAAADAGIPAVTLEAGEPLRLQEDAVEHTVKALYTLLDTMQMYDKRSLWGNPEPAYYSSAWVRADQGGILLAQIKLGRKVKKGDVLGTVTDPITNERAKISAPFAGRIIGMALNQFVMPGYATFHIATEAELDAVPHEEHYHAEGLDVAVSESMGGDESE